MAGRQIEARLYWGGELEAVTYTALRAGLRVDDLRLPSTGDEAVTDERGALVAGAIQLENEQTIELALVEKEGGLPRTIGDGRVERALLAAVALHAVFAGLAYHGRSSAGDEEARAQATMAAYLAAIDEHAGDRSPEAIPAQTPPPDEKGGGSAAKGAPGAAGNPARTNEIGRAKETKGAVHHAARPEIGGATDVSTFGMLALVAADRPGENAGSSPWAKDLGPAAMGNIFGATIDDAFGNGGLGLTGNGEGGGGKGSGVELSIDALKGGSGTCGDDCVGGLRGHGRMSGPKLSGEHVSHFSYAVVRCGKTVESDCYPQVNGRLPPEAVQRVVRASFGRFRGCYEEGLRRNPNLEGRISTKFVIGRDGAVAMASLANNTLSDPSVVNCVQRAFYGLSFPQPEGGIVTVEYPIVFSTSL